MKEMVRYGTVLAIICVVASGSLAIVNAVTRPKIIAQAQAEEEMSLKEVFPEGAKFDPVKSGEGIVYYKVFGRDDKVIGIVFKAQGKGYSSIVETMAGMKLDGTITSIKILNQNETPGLGANVIEPSFTDRFKGKDIPGLNNVQAITGATISSKAVIDSVKKKAEELKPLIAEFAKNAKSK
jgi:electron transport complex protein RnfG